MTIKFTSLISNQGKDSKIQFTENVKIFEDFGYQVYEFNEPSNNTKNRIEVKDGEVNIHAGSSYINLLDKQKCSIQYQTPAGIMIIESYTDFIKIKEDDIEFKYSLRQNEQVFGTFHIKLKITR